MSSSSGGEECLVEMILNEKLVCAKKMYKVRWNGPEKESWISLKRLQVIFRYTHTD
jgi:hypothetical protein